jgi:L-amino acid N-acyltransferase YncA
VDGIEGAAKLQDLLKSYQLQEHVDKKSREAAEREKALQAKAQEAEQKFAQRIEYAERLTNVAANQLMQEFQSIDWKALEQQDPGTAALWKQKFQERHAQLQGVHHSIQQEKAQAQQKTQAETLEALQREAERLPMLIPEWKDQAVAQKERAEIRDWAIKAGYEPSEVDSISKAHHVAVLRKAMLADRLQSHKADVENKVRKAPVLVKPGAQQINSQAQTLQNLKTAVKKSGGKGGSVAAYLLATGKV